MFVFQGCDARSSWDGRVALVVQKDHDLVFTDRELRFDFDAELEARCWPCPRAATSQNWLKKFQIASDAKLGGEWPPENWHQCIGYPFVQPS